MARKQFQITINDPNKWYSRMEMSADMSYDYATQNILWIIHKPISPLKRALNNLLYKVED